MSSPAVKSLIVVLSCNKHYLIFQPESEAVFLLLINDIEDLAIALIAL